MALRPLSAVESLSIVSGVAWLCLFVRCCKCLRPNVSSVLCPLLSSLRYLLIMIALSVVSCLRLLVRSSSRVRDLGAAISVLYLLWWTWVCLVSAALLPSMCIC